MKSVLQNINYLGTEFFHIYRLKVIAKAYFFSNNSSLPAIKKSSHAGKLNYSNLVYLTYFDTLHFIQVRIVEIYWISVFNRSSMGIL